MIKTEKDRRSISFGRVSMACKRSQIVATVRTSASNTKRPEPGGALVSVIGFSTSAVIPVSKYIGKPGRGEATGHSVGVGINTKKLRVIARKIFKAKFVPLSSEHAVQVPFMQPAASVPRYLVEPEEEQSCEP